MPPVTMSPAPVIAALDSKESGVTKVIYRRQSPLARGCGKGPTEADSREIPAGTGLHKDTVTLFTFGRREEKGGCGGEGGGSRCWRTGGAGSLSQLPRAHPWQVSCEPRRVTTS